MGHKSSGAHPKPPSKDTVRDKRNMLPRFTVEHYEIEDDRGMQPKKVIRDIVPPGDSYIKTRRMGL